ncbi:hypothetical protein BLNAU_12800 [Blattamonas nauphoetae]|uniref:Uncharacterized protein n=1 Tax=Blattamonas nauphoetae TaxID=2049346 RepID=A0ABQ9X380_9EUKA|nr:hypothetical protein BLNAU_19671 [Blattamonas nauphoetae]KAK2952241.1 hypothetical protein BLNAU_12800 [Blattamonas nauphoetae]
MSTLTIVSSVEGWTMPDDAGDTVSLKCCASSFASLSSVGSVLEKDQQIVAACEGERRIFLPPGQMGEEEEKEWAKREGMRQRGTFLLSRDSFTVASEDDNQFGEFAQPSASCPTHTHPTIPSGFTTITLTKQMNRTEDLAALFLEPSGLTAS